MSEKLKPCPRCGNTTVDYSIRKATRCREFDMVCKRGCANRYIVRFTHKYSIEEARTLFFEAWNGPRPIEDALLELVAATNALMEARNEEMLASIAHDDYHTGGKIHTEGRLEDARARVLVACNRGSTARAKCQALGLEV